MEKAGQVGPFAAAAFKVDVRAPASGRLYLITAWNWLMSILPGMQRRDDARASQDTAWPSFDTLRRPESLFVAVVDIV